MGSGAWSTDVYKNRAAARPAGSTAFSYSAAAKQSGNYKVHDDLNPKDVIVRESRDSDEHPNSVPVAVLFDVTGSMGSIPIELQKRLPTLLELLQYKEYVPDAQILFGAIGDAYSDKVPLQVGQFESDNRMEDCLEKIFLEGNGGGQNRESYDLGLYFMARHIATDAWEKRQKKGYLFLIGDEEAYPGVKPEQVRAIIGDDLNEPIALDALITEIQERWDFYFIVPGGHDRNAQFWKDKLGQNCLLVPDLDAVAETIALTIGVAEQVIELEQGLKDLEAHGTSQTTVAAVKTALS